jgi:cobalt/nickel transport system permease protein
MHLPDGFLNPTVFVSGWVLAMGTLTYALKKTRQVLKDKMIPLMGVMAAFIFAAQMLNFPVLGGTSGHLLGGILAAVTLGPYAGFIVLSLVLIVQCLVFQDGGITALGANIVNMGLVGTLISYYIYVVLKKTLFKNNIVPAVFISAWLSVVMASAMCAAELSFSGTSPFKVVFPAMVFVHVFIGIGEALITTLVVKFILRVRPDLIFSK